MVDPATGGPGRGGQHVDERGRVVIGDQLALGDRLDGERGGADRLELRLGGAVHLLAGGHLDLAHRLEASVVRPRLGQLGAGVARDHAPSLAIAPVSDYAIVREVTGDANHAGDWRAAINELAAFDRPSASDGERRAAELIAARLRALGCRVEVEEERAHGGYWWPIGIVNTVAAGAGLLALRSRRTGFRALAAGLAGLGAAALWDDLSHGKRWFRRALLPHRSTWNVVAEAGDATAERTVVLIAHHDAAHSGLIFHPVLPRIPLKVMPRWHAKAGRSFPLLYTVWLGPVLVCAGSLTGIRRLLGAGIALAAGATAGDGRHRPARGRARSQRQPELGRSASRHRPPRSASSPLEGLRVLLVSTGSEESFSEGMQGFGDRHFDGLDPERTEMVCLECLGGPTLIVVEGEGMLRMRDYPAGMRDALERQPPAPACRSCAACERRPPPTRSSRSAPATGWRRSPRSTRPSCR